MIPTIHDPYSAYAVDYGPRLRRRRLRRWWKKNWAFLLAQFFLCLCWTAFVIGWLAIKFA